jgi:hypothetical protein
MANGDQVQYIKLPDGSYGKFRMDATDAQIKGQISKLFPQAYGDPLKTGAGMEAKTQEQARQKVTSPDMKRSTAPDWMRGLTGFLPIAGATAGGALASPGVVTTPAGIGLGAAAGKSGELLANRLIFGKDEISPSSKEGLKQTGMEGAMAAATAGATEGVLAGGGKVIKALSSKVEPLARLNKILGVGAKEVRVGATPSSLDEFAANPARGVVKAGIPEKDLAKMNPLERVKTITAARESAGAKLDQALEAHPEKTINVQKTVEDVFSKLDDKRLQKLAEARLRRILSEAKITKPLSQLTPMEARTVQRGLDEFANFAPEGTYKSFSDIATSLRRGISKATRQALPETAELDQDYGDLAGATKAVRRQANEYARTVPESKLRKLAPYIAGAVGGSLGAAGAKYLLPTTRSAP